VAGEYPRELPSANAEPARQKIYRRFVGIESAFFDKPQRALSRGQ
jgi:hypothetical protein